MSKPNGPPRTKLNPNFFKRDKSGMVKLRLNLTEEEALLIEEAAGDVPVMLFIHRALGEQSRLVINRRNRRENRKYEIIEEP